MVHMLPVAKLVDHHIVPYLRRGKHQQAVEIQVARPGAAAPAGLLGPDTDPPEADPHQGGKMGSPPGKILPGLLLQRRQLLFGQGRLGGAAFVFAQSGVEPDFFGGHKIPDSPFRQPPGCPHQNTAVRPDLQGQGLPGAADEGIGDVQKITSG